MFSRRWRLESCSEAVILVDGSGEGWLQDSAGTCDILRWSLDSGQMDTAQNVRRRIADIFMPKSQLLSSFHRIARCGANAVNVVYCRCLGLGKHLVVTSTSPSRTKNISAVEVTKNSESFEGVVANNRRLPLCCGIQLL